MAWVGEDVARRRRQQTGTDRYGNPVYGVADVTLPERAAFDPGGSREPVEVGRAAVVTNPKLFFLRPVDLTAADRVLVRGVEYAVQGHPAVWDDPFGSDVGGVVVELQRVEG